MFFIFYKKCVKKKKETITKTRIKIKFYQALKRDGSKILKKFIITPNNQIFIYFIYICVSYSLENISILYVVK